MHVRKFGRAEPAVGVVIPSASKLSLVEENMGASLAGSLPVELVAAIEARS